MGGLNWDLYIQEILYLHLRSLLDIMCVHLTHSAAVLFLLSHFGPKEEVEIP